MPHLIIATLATAAKDTDTFSITVFLASAFLCSLIGYAFRATLERPKIRQAFLDGKNIGARETEDRFTTH